MRKSEVRDELHQLAGQLGLPRLAELAEALKHRKRSARSPNVSKSVTRETEAAIRKYKAEHPDASQHQIARVFDVNQGRVSEALVGKRK